MLCGLSNAIDLLMVLVVGALGMVGVGMVAASQGRSHADNTELYILWGIAFFIAGLSGVLASARDVAMIQITQDAAEGKGSVNIGPLFNRITPNMDLAFRTQLPLMLLVLLGMTLFLLPGVLLLASCPALVSEVLETQVSFGTALSNGWRRFRAFPGWHIRWYYLSAFGIMIVGSLPVVGLVLVLPARALLEVYAWRALRDVRLPA